MSRTLNVVSYIYRRQYDNKSLLERKLVEQGLDKCPEKLYCTDLKAHFGCVNAIEFSNHGGEHFISGGDDRRVLIWQTEKAIAGKSHPNSMKNEHNSNVFCLTFDNTDKHIISGGNDEQVLIHDIETGETLDVFQHEEAVYALSADPVNNSIFATASDDGRILIIDSRDPASTDPFCLANYTAPMHSVKFNPVEPRLLATANSREGIGLWDLRKPRSCLLRYGGSYSMQSCMSVQFSHDGSRLVALRRRLPPILYDIHQPTALCQFDHSGYYNSCTMKTCCFAGDTDQYILSGSDDFNVYMWKIPKQLPEFPWVSSAHRIMKGHRSIVNQVRFNPNKNIVLSSGVEKVIKAWSPFPMTAKNNIDRMTFEERTIYSHEDYYNMFLEGGRLMTHDYSQQSTDEDPKMIALFDSLVQQEINGSSSSDESATESGGYSLVVQDISSTSSSSEDETSPNIAPHRGLITDENQAITLNDHTSMNSNEDVPMSTQNDAASLGSDTETDTGSDTSVQATLSLLQPTSGQHRECVNFEMRSQSSQVTNQNRRTISDLISEKRGEYLTAALKTIPREKFKTKMEERKKCKTKLKKKRTISKINNALISADSDSDQETTSPNIVIGSESVSEGEETALPSPLQLPENKPINTALKNLCSLRKRVADSDDEISIGFPRPDPLHHSENKHNTAEQDQYQCNTDDGNIDADAPRLQSMSSDYKTYKVGWDSTNNVKRATDSKGTLSSRESLGSFDARSTDCVVPNFDKEDSVKGVNVAEEGSCSSNIQIVTTPFKRLKKRQDDNKLRHYRKFNKNQK